MVHRFRSDYDTKIKQPDRIVENFHSQNIDITPVMEQLQSMDENYVSGWDPTVEI